MVQFNSLPQGNFTEPDLSSKGANFSSSLLRQQNAKHEARVQQQPESKALGASVTNKKLKRISTARPGKPSPSPSNEEARKMSTNGLVAFDEPRRDKGSEQAIIDKLTQELKIEIPTDKLSTWDKMHIWVAQNLDAEGSTEDLWKKHPYTWSMRQDVRQGIGLALAGIETGTNVVKGSVKLVWDIADFPHYVADKISHLLGLKTEEDFRNSKEFQDYLKTHPTFNKVDTFMEDYRPDFGNTIDMVENIVYLGYNLSAGLIIALLEYLSIMPDLSKLDFNKLPPKYRLLIKLTPDSRRILTLLKVLYLKDWKPLLDRGEYGRAFGHVLANLFLLCRGPKGINKLMKDTGLDKAEETGAAARDTSAAGEAANAAPTANDTRVGASAANGTSAANGMGDAHTTANQASGAKGAQGANAANTGNGANNTKTVSAANNTNKAGSSAVNGAANKVSGANTASNIPQTGSPPVEPPPEPPEPAIASSRTRPQRTLPHKNTSASTQTASTPTAVEEPIDVDARASSTQKPIKETNAAKRPREVAETQPGDYAKLIESIQSKLQNLTNKLEAMKASLGSSGGGNAFNDAEFFSDYYEIENLIDNLPDSAFKKSYKYYLRELFGNAAQTRYQTMLDKLKPRLCNGSIDDLIYFYDELSNSTIANVKNACRVLNQYIKEEIDFAKLHNADFEKLLYNLEAAVKNTGSAYGKDLAGKLEILLLKLHNRAQAPQAAQEILDLLNELDGGSVAIKLREANPVELLKDAQKTFPKPKKLTSAEICRNNFRESPIIRNDLDGAWQQIRNFARCKTFFTKTEGAIHYLDTPVDTLKRIVHSLKYDKNFFNCLDSPSDIPNATKVLNDLEQEANQLRRFIDAYSTKTSDTQPIMQQIRKIFNLIGKIQLVVNSGYA
jgi:hypothetical protein